MDQRRVILAIFLMLIVAVLPGILFPSKRAVRPSGGPADSVATGARPPAVESAGPRAPAPSSRPTESPAGAPQSPQASAETVWVTNPVSRLGFTTRGAQLVSVELLQYHSFAPGDSARHVELVPEGRPLFAERLVVGSDTVSLADLTFVPSRPALAVAGGDTVVTFTAPIGSGRVTQIGRASCRERVYDDV